MHVSSAIRHLGGASLAAALCASIAVHLSALVLLTQIDGSPRAGHPLAPERRHTLEATLTAPTDATPAITLTPIVAPVATDTPKPPQPVAMAERGNRQTKPNGPRAGEQSTTGLNRGHVVISDKRPRAEFGSEIEGEATAEFPAEVQGGVEIPPTLVVEYPPDALAEGREATVLVWVVVDAQGKVEAAHLVDGAPGFTEAVESALAGATFIPAMDNYKPIRFYATLSFDFRLDAGNASAARVTPQ